ncbi:MAG: sigma-70 family RNA polymerase sigma factor [Planctomycetia bacterium]|nr:sigma-70 family RNA polymerase sigma factor [Planctomycetia bacterium]
MNKDECPPDAAWLDDPDVQLMLRVREGDAAAFEELMMNNQSRVLSLLQNLTGDRELAEDLAQEVFLRIYRTRARYVPTARFSTWLYRVVHNLAFNAMRFKRRHKELLFGAVTRPNDGQSSSENGWSVEETLQEKSGLMPTRQIARQETCRKVREAIDALGDRQRMALLLHRFEGMSYEQIGQIMSLTPQAVKSLLCRARVKLRELLAPFVADDSQIEVSNIEDEKDGEEEEGGSQS